MVLAALVGRILLTSAGVWSELGWDPAGSATGDSSLGVASVAASDGAWVSKGSVYCHLRRRDGGLKP